MLNSHMHLMQNTTTQWRRRGTQSFRKICTSIFICKVVCERELETEQNCNILTPHSNDHQRCVFLVLQGCSTGGPGALSAGCWLSLPHLVTNGSPNTLRAPSAGWWVSLPHLHSNFSDLQLTDFLCSPSYIIVQSPTQYLWNGMFDRHQAEINVMQFTGHSLPVHQSMSVPWDFTLSHIVSQARLRDFFS